MTGSDPQQPRRRFGRDSVSRYRLLVALGAVLVLVLTVIAYLVSARAIERLVHRGNDASATITAALVEREFDHWTATLTSHAGFPVLAASVAAGDVDAVRRRLEGFVTSYPQLDRAFVTDTTGLLWADHPVAPESLGRRFDDRAWFRGVTGAGGPYVSEVYRRNAEPQIRVVAVAVPVRSPATGEVAGFLVAQVRLDDLSELLGRVEVGDEGIVLLRDHRGSVAAHPSLDLPERRYPEYAGLLPPRTSPGDTPGETPGATPGDTPPGSPTRGEYEEPLTGERMVASSLPVRVGDHTWTVISQQPRAVAFAPVRTLALELGAAGILLALLMGGLLWGIGREIARRREAEEELTALNEELERRVEERTAALKEKEELLVQARKMESIGRLAGGVAHDFNNLLTVILGSVDLLLPHLPEGTPEREEAVEIRRGAEKAADLTRQLLAFSRKQVMQPRILDVNESVTRMRGILERVLGEDIELAWRLSPDLHPVKFDPSQIEQVVLNLAVNARDAMPDGGKLVIQTQNVVLDPEYVEEHPTAQVGPHVMLAVTDSGTGMDAHTRERIFEPFFTTKGLGHGTGLGLSTVYGIVRQGGGNIWVYSEPEQGTTFKVYLPRTTDAPEEAPSVPPAFVESGSGTVLVVEDEPAVGALLVRILDEAGYDVRLAADGDAAVREMADGWGPVDLLLTDVVLPDVSGPALAERLVERQDGLRVLFMSGYTDEAVVHQGMLEEGTAFIEKPIRPRRLLEKVREVMSAPSNHRIE